MGDLKLNLPWSGQKLSTLRGIFFITIFCNLIIGLARSQGVLQRLELLVFDVFVQVRPLEKRQPRIVLVTVSESDIQKLEKWLLADAKLAQLLQNVAKQKPRAIGLDIYRDLPVPPGTETLERIYRSLPQLITIQKVAGTQVPPPPVMAALGQTGANDLVIDQDGKVRRFLLSLRDEKGEIILSLGLRLALIYLAEEGIIPTSVGEDIILGKARIKPITPNSGSYIQQDTGGFQILANYGRLYPDYPRIAITDALEDRIPLGIMTDKIVLIGATAASLGDRFQTPLIYEADDLPGTPGVEIHAAVVEQLLSSALEGRPLLQFWSDRVEILWIVFWGMLGGILAWSYDKGKTTIGLAVLGIVVLVTSSYILFIFGVWIPVVPPFLAYLLTFGVDLAYILWQNLSYSERQLAEYALALEEKVKERTKELESKNIQLQEAQLELTESFDRLATATKEIGDLNQKLQSENLRMKYELDVAGKIQAMILPKADLAELRDLDIAGFMQPATEVGGDYYDIIFLPDRVRIAIGDVTGHGLESGVVMLMLQTAIATMSEFSPLPPTQVLAITNRVLLHNLARMNSDKSLSLTIVDVKEDTLVITGQHEEVIIVRQEGTIERINTDELGFPVGLVDDIETFLNSLEVNIAPGDVVVLFTDGVTEAANPQNELYGIDRLCQIVYDNREKSAKDICLLVTEDVLKFIADTVVYDDITLVVIKKKDNCNN
ncbi:MAG: CHASE2 domain-containing protein [Pseudanabaenaceae cyanobacterium]